jgi:hypothetical protein
VGELQVGHQQSITEAPEKSVGEIARRWILFQSEDYSFIKNGSVLKLKDRLALNGSASVRLNNISRGYERSAGCT